MVLQELFTIARQSEAQRKPFGPLEKLYAQGDPTEGCYCKMLLDMFMFISYDEFIHLQCTYFLSSSSGCARRNGNSGVSLDLGLLENFYS